MKKRKEKKNEGQEGETGLTGIPLGGERVNRVKEGEQADVLCIHT
jgi:hypothetical protein